MSQAKKDDAGEMGGGQREGVCMYVCVCIRMYIYKCACMQGGRRLKESLGGEGGGSTEGEKGREWGRDGCMEKMD